VKTSSVVLLLACYAFTAGAGAQTPTPKRPVTPSVQNDPLQNNPAMDTGVDVTASTAETNAYRADIRGLLKEQNFGALEQAATEARATRARFLGGWWKLRAFYAVVQVPVNPLPNGADWEAHLALLQSWAATMPQSITARVSLAHAYLKFAWVARGNGLADTVTPEGWKLFNARAAKAKAILDDAENLDAKCPDWYYAEMIAGLALGQDKTAQADLFHRAIAFEPEYLYNYTEYANYLLPKWYGNSGDAAQMANEVISDVGREQGEFLYFMIGGFVATNGSKTELAKMSWQRIQQGYATLQRLYGTSNEVVNEYALMAVKFNDLALAQQLFIQIGPYWNKAVWRSEGNFRSTRARIMAAGANGME
jgi:hypothetical protein